MEITFSPRFRGPLTSANGGYACGRLAAFVDAWLATPTSTNWNPRADLAPVVRRVQRMRTPAFMRVDPLLLQTLRQRRR